jgi:hypothetical protein
MSFGLNALPSLSSAVAQKLWRDRPRPSPSGRGRTCVGLVEVRSLSESIQWEGVKGAIAKAWECGRLGGGWCVLAGGTPALPGLR